VDAVPEDLRRRHSLRRSGRAGARPVVLVHGFGCDQGVWRDVAPGLDVDHEVWRYDHLGSGGSDLTAYDAETYASLGAYAADLVTLLERLDLRDTVLVGHSVGATIAVLAAAQAPDRVGALALIGASPRYLDDDGYTGGFSRDDLDGLLEVMDANFLGWSQHMAPVIMGNGDRPELGQDLAGTFCRNDPVIARQFARATFLSDHRSDFARLRVPSLLLQARDDVISPQTVGEWLHTAVAGSELVLMEATGHCPHVSAPQETVLRLRAWLGSR
jgi:sigma-B regulation protein RsbQ